MSERAKAQIWVLNKPEYSPKAAYYFAEALAQTGKLDWKLEYELTNKTRKFLKLHDESLAQEFSVLNYELVEQVENLIESEKYEPAKELLLQLKRPDGTVYLGLGNCCYYLKNFVEAERYFLKAIDKGNVNAMYNLAVLYRTQFKDYPKAKDYYMMAINRGDDWAMHDLGGLYHFEFKDYHQAEYYYLMAINKGNDWAMRDLAQLYHFEFKDYPKAEHYYLMALEHNKQRYVLENLVNLYLKTLNQPEKAEICLLTWAEKGHPPALNAIAWGCFEKKIHKDTALCCAEPAIKKTPSNENAHTLACIYVWHHRFVEAVKVAKIFIDKEDFHEKYPENGVNIYLLLLLAKQQYSTVRDYFENPQLTLKDRFKPIYYAFLKLTNDPEFGRMPPELDETVTQILAKIQTMAADYA